MKELDISAIPNNPRLNSAIDRQYQYYPNKLKRNFLTEAPNLVWVSYITYAKLALILCTCVLSLIYTHVKLWHIVFQNTSTEFCMLLNKHNVSQSFSASGAPHDNAVAESFVATI